MTTNTKYWDNLITNPDNAVKVLLKEPAELLGNITNNKVKAVVETVNGSSDNPMPHHRFFLFAPSLNITYLLLTVTHLKDTAQYPVEIVNSLYQPAEDAKEPLPFIDDDPQPIPVVNPELAPQTANNATEFTKILAQQLNSEPVTQYINNLVALSV